MDRWTKTKEWINENAPMLNTLYQNKYVGMAYDRFASLPPKQQKQTVVGGFSAVVGLIVLYLMVSYWSLWSTVSKNHEYYAMANLLQQFQKTRRDKAAQIAMLEKNAELANPGSFRDHIVGQAKAANISPRMIAVDEKSEDGAADGEKTEISQKQVKVTVDKVNLSQLKNFLQNIEFGRYNLNISDLKIVNDERIRGYMKAELTVAAFLFQPEEGK